MKKILWIRTLSCGHERATNVAFMCEKYDKPTMGGECYCRECNKIVKITAVRQAKQNRTGDKNG